VHEEIVARIAETEHPEIHLSVASRLFPVAREYERTMTTVLNSFTGMRLASYIERIEAELSRRGLRVPVSFMQGFGGTLSAAEAKLRPITLVDSGPAGGVIAAQRLARGMGLDNVLGADMGGTSFDVSVLSNGETKVADRVTLGGQFLTCVSKIDVHPIGAGGGSIAWIDARGVPQIGPRSAGSAPGPACYGHGGTEPTVTDAVVTLGIIDPSYFLGGRRSLDVAAARSAIDSVVARPLGLSIEDAASALYRLVVANMSSAVRAVTIERGRDPRQFSLCGFGGALGIFAADIARTLGISRVVLPGYGAVFSAYGLLTSQDMRVRSRSIYWEGGDPAPVWDALIELESDARRSLAASGFGEDSITVKWEGNFVFQGQYWEMSVPLVRASRLADFDLAKVQDGFADHYEAEFGAGTAWQNASVVLLGVRVVAAGHADTFETQAARVPGQAATAPGLIGRRQMVLADRAGPVAVDVYDGTTLAPGHRIDGPGVVEHEQTTHLVPRDWSLRVDGLGNYLLEDHQRPAVTEVVAP
jgi:N-methylhydantoinase A